MRLEVLVGTEDPAVYPIHSKKMNIGSSEQSDIVISAPGISRKHLQVIVEGESYYVMDLGSKNGSFINEERLVPGRRVELPSFFPVRLGHNVLLSLISDAEDTEAVPGPLKEGSSRGLSKDDEEDTRLISLTDPLRRIRTEDLVLIRNQKRSVQRRAEFPSSLKTGKGGKGMNFVPLLALLILLGAAYYSFHTPEQITSVTRTKKVTRPRVPSVKEYSPLRLVERSDLPPREAYNEKLNSMKCTTDFEKYLCDFFPEAQQDPYGVLQVGLTFHVFLDGTPYFEEAEKIVPRPLDHSDDAFQNHQDLVYQTGIYLYLLDNLTFLDLKIMKDFNLALVFFRQGEAGPEVARVMAVTPEAYNKLSEVVKRENLPYIKTNGAFAFRIVKDYYYVY